MAIESPQKNDEFYSEYAPIPRGYRRFLLQFIPLLLLGVALFVILFPGIHNQFNSGNIQGSRELEGLLVADLCPI